MIIRGTIEKTEDSATGSVVAWSGPHEVAGNCFVRLFAAEKVDAFKAVFLLSYSVVVTCARPSSPRCSQDVVEGMMGSTI